MKTLNIQNAGMLAVFFFGSLFGNGNLFAQQEQQPEKNKKVVEVNIEVDSSTEEGTSNIKIVINNDGEEFVWSGDGLEGEFDLEALEALKDLDIQLDADLDFVFETEDVDGGEEVEKIIKVIKNKEGTMDTVVEVRKTKTETIIVEDGNDKRPNQPKKVVIKIDPTDTVSENGEVHTQITKIEVTITEPSADDTEVLKKKAPKSAEKNNLELNRLAFYPNPNDGMFHLKFQAEETGDLQVRVYDLAGKTVFKEDVKDFSGNFEREIDLSGESSGTYLLQVIQNGKALNKKIVVQ